MVKVNQVTKAVELQKLGAIDIAGFVVGETDSARAITPTTFAALRTSYDGATSVQLVAGIDHAAAAVDELEPDFVEFTVIDREKAAESEAQLRSLGGLDRPKIANGLFLLKDDLSLLDRTAHLDVLLEAGVRYFQIEIDSAIDPDQRLTAGERARVADLCAQYPVILGDSAVLQDGYPVLGQQGFVLTLGSDDVSNHDYSTRSYSLPRAIRAVRNLRA